MKKDTSKLRQELRHTEGARRSHVEKILEERGPLRRGSFVTIWRKCGKPNCRCAEGEGHPAKYLSVKEAGRTKMIYVPPGKEVQVAREAWHYRRLRQHRAMLAKLSFQSLALIDELAGALESKEAIPRRKANGSKARSHRQRSTKKGG